MCRVAFLRCGAQGSHSVPGFLNLRSRRNCVGATMPGGMSALHLLA